MSDLLQKRRMPPKADKKPVSNIPKVTKVAEVAKVAPVEHQVTFDDLDDDLLDDFAEEPKTDSVNEQVPKVEKNVFVPELQEYEHTAKPNVLRKNNSRTVIEPNEMLSFNKDMFRDGNTVDMNRIVTNILIKDIQSDGFIISDTYKQSVIDASKFKIAVDKADSVHNSDSLTMKDKILRAEQLGEASGFTKGFILGKLSSIIHYESDLDKVLNAMCAECNLSTAEAQQYLQLYIDKYGGQANGNR